MLNQRTSVTSLCLSKIKIKIHLSANLDAIGTDRRAKEEQNPITCVTESQDRSSFRFATIFILQRTRAFCGKRIKFEKRDFLASTTDSQSAAGAKPTVIKIPLTAGARMEIICLRS